MGTAQTATMIGYDVESGKVLFTYSNMPSRSYDGKCNLPGAGQLIEHNDRIYRIVGVRKTSTETNWELDLQEESSKT
jgi:hypothetical protein